MPGSSTLNAPAPTPDLKKLLSHSTKRASVWSCTELAAEWTECPVLVIGTGRLASAVVRLLRGWRVPTVVAGRDEDALRLFAAGRGVTVVPYSGRAGALAGIRIVINTVPAMDALSGRVLSRCRGKLVVGVASPPGGLDHTKPLPDGVDVYWARGLAGRRAPVTAGDALFDLVISLVS